MMSQEWQKVFDRHTNILKEHLELWTSIRDQEGSGTKGYDIAHGCISRTQDMMQNVKLLSTSLGSKDPLPQPNGTTRYQLDDMIKGSHANPATELHSQTEKLSLGPSKKRRMEDDERRPAERKSETSIQDFSGLFTIDSNPTPVEQLLAHKSSKEISDRPGKRVRLSKPERDILPIGLPAIVDNALRIPTNDKTSAIPTATTSTEMTGESNDNSFLEKVDKRHKEKEEKRKSKSDKKRKRESNASTDSPAGDGQQNMEKRKKKKQKRDGEIKGKSTIKKDSTSKKPGSKRKEKSKRKKKS